MSWCLKIMVHCNKCADFSFVNWFHKLSDRGPMCYGTHKMYLRYSLHHSLSIHTCWLLLLISL